MKRVVTGHNAQGQSVVASEGMPPHIASLQHIPGTVFYELWKTSGMPTPVGNGDDPTLGPLCLPPPPMGTALRIVDIPPDTDDFLARGADIMKKQFAQMGDEHASTVQANSPHPLMHRTESVDYGIVIEGELVLILDQGEAVLKVGDVVIQRGTNHAWANRSNRVCRVVFILIDGRFDPSMPIQAGTR